MLLVVDADPSAEWQVWYQDMFDRETPRQVVAKGTGLAAGLTELWRRHLHEAVQPNGSLGFSRYNLWWKQASRSASVVGDSAGLVQIREWALSRARRNQEGSGEDVLSAVAGVHSHLMVAGRSCACIPATAALAPDPVSFLDDLARLVDTECCGG